MVSRDSARPVVAWIVFLSLSVRVILTVSLSSMGKVPPVRVYCTAFLPGAAWMVIKVASKEEVLTALEKVKMRSAGLNWKENPSSSVGVVSASIVPWIPILGGTSDDRTPDESNKNMLSRVM